MSTMPEIMIPALEALRASPDKVMAKYWHDTVTLIIPPNFTGELIWMPRPGYVLILLFDVIGRGYPYDPDTGKIVTTVWYENTEAGFWHETADMRWHWDPIVSSLCDKPYPHFSVVTERSPYRIVIYNPTDDYIYFNLTIHIWEMTEETYEEVIRPYLLGIFYFFWNIGNIFLSRAGERPLAYLVRMFEELRTRTRGSKK